MKTYAYIPLHYGAEYLDAVIRSIDPFVEKIIILYANRPTFGHHSNWQCPESEEQLKSIAFNASGKIKWVQVHGGSESQHRNQVFDHCEGADLLLAVDADEVWEPLSLQVCLQAAANGGAQRYNIHGFVHLWKSFNYCCRDSFAPGRIYALNRLPDRRPPHDGCTEETISGLVYHFGYAQSQVMIDYKMEIHGHKSEIRPEWPELYRNWTPEVKDLHPAAYGCWPEAMPFDKNTMPEILKQHPNFNKEVI